MKLDSIQHVAVIGSGMIGASMAALFTGNGYRTTIYAINDKEAQRGQDRYDSCYQDLMAEGLVTEKQAKACNKLLSVTQTYDDIADADFVFECVFENKDVKFSVYREVEKHCRQFKAIASSSSAMSADDLAEGLTQKDKMETKAQEQEMPQKAQAQSGEAIAALLRAVPGMEEYTLDVEYAN